MPGIELFASAAYKKCGEEGTSRGLSFDNYADGVEIMAGINIRLGGRGDSLVNIDRSNALDTEAWACSTQGVVN